MSLLLGAEWLDCALLLRFVRAILQPLDDHIGRRYPHITCGELDEAMERAEQSGTGAYIEVVTGQYEASPLAMKLHDAVKTLTSSDKIYERVRPAAASEGRPSVPSPSAQRYCIVGYRLRRYSQSNAWLKQKRRYETDLGVSCLDGNSDFGTGG